MFDMNKDFPVIKEKGQNKVLLSSEPLIGYFIAFVLLIPVEIIASSFFWDILPLNNPKATPLLELLLTMGNYFQILLFIILVCLIIFIDIVFFYTLTFQTKILITPTAIESQFYFAFIRFHKKQVPKENFTLFLATTKNQLYETMPQANPKSWFRLLLQNNTETIVIREFQHLDPEIDKQYILLVQKHNIKIDALIIQLFDIPEPE